MMLWQVVDHPASTVRQKIVSILGVQYSWVDLQEQRLICRRLARFTAAHSNELRRRIACEARVMAFCNQSDVELLNLTRIDVKLFSFMIGHFDGTHAPPPRHSRVALSGVDTDGLLSRIDTTPALFRTHM